MHDPLDGTSLTLVWLVCRALQVARAAASASAFSLGFFPRSPQAQLRPLQHAERARAAQPQQQPSLHRRMAPGGVLGGEAAHAGSVALAAWDASNGLATNSRPQPVAISMLPQQQDPVLRFFAMCPAYLQHEHATTRWLVSGRTVWEGSG